MRLGICTINEARRAMGYKPLKHPGADIPFSSSSPGPLTLDILREGGVRPQNMGALPEGYTAAVSQGKVLADEMAELLWKLRKAVRTELSERRAG